MAHKRRRILQEMGMDSSVFAGFPKCSEFAATNETNRTASNQANWFAL